MLKNVALYYFLISPPSRAVLFTAKSIGIELDLIPVDIRKKEHLTPEFIKLNPQHTLPLINDNGVIIYDSHAICTYLCDTYAKQDTLYPRDLVKRSLVDARLHFDTGFLWARLRYFFEPIFYDGSTEVPLEKIEYLQRCWPIMESFLERGPYLCGADMTIADFCCFATVSSIDRVTIDKPDKYPKLMGWIERMKENPFHQIINVEGADIFQKYFGDVVKRGKVYIIIMTNKPILYYINRSPPCRTVLMVAKAIGVELELKLTLALKGENKTPAFLKMNPQHTLPVLDDNGAIIVDSHAICSYLSEKYAKDDKLYPKDLVKRALVDARMHFDNGFLFARIRSYIEPIFYYGCAEIPQEKIDYFKLTLPIVEAFLENGPYICGNEMTLADFCFITSLSSVDRTIGIEEDKYPKLIDWMRRMAKLPYYETTNAEGATILQDTILSKIKENRENLKSN